MMILSSFSFHQCKQFYKFMFDSLKSKCKLILALNHHHRCIFVFCPLHLFDLLSALLFALYSFSFSFVLDFCSLPLSLHFNLTSITCPCHYLSLFDSFSLPFVLCPLSSALILLPLSFLFFCLSVNNLLHNINVKLSNQSF